MLEIRNVWKLTNNIFTTKSVVWRNTATVFKRTPAVLFKLQQLFHLLPTMLLMFCAALDKDMNSQCGPRRCKVADPCSRGYRSYDILFSCETMVFLSVPSILFSCKHEWFLSSVACYNCSLISITVCGSFFKHFR